MDITAGSDLDNALSCSVDCIDEYGGIDWSAMDDDDDDDEEKDDYSPFKSVC